ncbi:MAG: MBL fold metallo-hydrolase, partial [Candidatus Obscuribacterales bacterium]|nr:MBL fold metallo-hydrolase [Candidatus Obscuribacterales bacterium]
MPRGKNELFAGYPEAYILDQPDGKKTRHLMWGDYIQLKGEENGEWIKVKSRGETGWMKKSDTQKNRLLEMNFVDVGQGDGCFIVTPDDDFILIDAGVNDNMYRFLRWRFNLKNHPQQVVPLKMVVISHPDKDHYYGMKSIFQDEQFTVGSLFHNGIIERKGGLGQIEKHDGHNYLVDVIQSFSSLKKLLNDTSEVASKQ